MAMNNYFDFAENDFQYFLHSYKSGFVANAMAADAQEICEKYMKHIVDTYCNNSDSMQEEAELNSVMRTYNLTKLYRFIENKTGLQFSTEFKSAMNAVNGFYFTARYPGDESIEVTKEDLDICNDAVFKCRNEIIKLQEILENKRKQILSEHPMS